ncbi:MAG TPA: hypothetical protein VF912_00300 [Anaeromyxobacter sp.]|nr:hypothetical protein [Gemmatimonadales bacterium]
MKRFAVVLTLLALAGFARASEVALSDTQLDAVAGGTESVALPTTNLNLNVSPITVTQTAVAVTTQTQTATLNNFPGKGHAYGLAKHAGFAAAWQTQTGVAAASNYVKINYIVNQHN